MLAESITIIRDPRRVEEVVEKLNRNNYRWSKAWLNKTRRIVHSVESDDRLYQDTVRKFYKYLSKHGYVVAIDPEELYEYLKEEKIN